jgi:GMP synthase-like glutamine amidotransferase
MRLHSLQHAPFEGLGSIAGWAEAHRHVVTATRLYTGDRLPAMADIDWLIVMGGPMGVHDEREFPWLSEEKRCIGDAIESGKRVLGICLGAQLIAGVLGARVYANRYEEIGWFPIDLTAAGARSALGQAISCGGAGGETVPAAMAPSLEVFHWHGDTFDLPGTAVQLARSAACEQQAFSFGDRVVGLQFHLEMTRAGAEALIDNCAGDLKTAPYVQSAVEMLANQDRFARINRVMAGLLDRMAAP